MYSFLKTATKILNTQFSQNLELPLFIPVFVYTSRKVHGYRVSHLSCLPCLILEHMAPPLSWWFQLDILGLTSHMYAHIYVQPFCLYVWGAPKYLPKWLYHSHSSSWQIFLDTSQPSSRFPPILGIKSYIILTCILNACLCISSCACWTSTFFFSVYICCLFLQWGCCLFISGLSVLLVYSRCLIFFP